MGWPFLRTVLAVGLCLSPASAAQMSDDAHRIQASVLGVDSHNDTVQHILYENVDIGNRLSDGSIDIPRLQEGGIHVPFFALWEPTYYKGSETVRRTLDFRDAMQTVLDKYPDQIELATSALDIERIVLRRKIAVVLTVDLRMLGLGKNALSFSALYQLLPLGMLGFTINLITGTMFFVATPQQYVGFLFFLKMILVVAGAFNVLYFMLLDEPWTIGEGDDASKKTKFVAASAIAIWIGVLFCGHMLPFLGNSF